MLKEFSFEPAASEDVEFLDEEGTPA